jgi:hypothetical protein
MGRARELECIQFQLQTLQEIAAPNSEVQYLSSQDGSHVDLDGDGQSTWRDYWARDW